MGWDPSLSEMQQAPPVTKPVGSMMRPLPRVWISASVNSAAHEIRDSGLPAVGVTEGFFYVGLVTQSSLASGLASGIHPDDSVSRVYDTRVVALPPYASGERALEIFASGEVSAIPIVDDYGHLMGVLTPADLYPKRDNSPRPSTIGGMATPFGVYLTTGSIGAGARGWALVATGALMSIIFCLISIVTIQLQTFAHGNGLVIPESALNIIQLVLFLLTFRLLPLSGIHAAEHKVVHAIEKGEELTRENVRRMPRVHPRCGTNLVVGISILTGVVAIDHPLLGLYGRLVLAVILTLMLWRPLGSLVQYWGTTKEPTDRQLDMGIRSGQELLTSYATGPGGRRNLLWRLWNSGVFHVMSGGFLIVGLVMLLQWAFRFELIPM